RGQEQEWWQQAKSAFPDMQFLVNLLIESDDLVVSNWTVKGTHTGTAFYDVPPSGETVEINGTAVLRIRDGRIVEHWGGPHCQQGLGLIRCPAHPVVGHGWDRPATGITAAWTRTRCCAPWPARRVSR